MTLRRKSTYAWALKHCADNPDIASALALPMFRDILDTIDANRAARFFIMMPPQVGKSLTGQLRFMRSKQVEPRSSLWYREAKDEVDAFASEKFNPLFDACPPLPALLFNDRNKRSKLRAAFPDQTNLALLSAGTKGNRQSRTACDIYLDEPWLYDAGWIGQIQKRHDAYPHDFREIYMSTGPTEGTEADQCWMSSDRKTWFVCCPECKGHFNPRRTHKDETTGERIGGLVYETAMRDDGTLDELAVSQSVTYRCPLCRTILPNSDATRAAMSGTASNPRGKYVAQNPAAAPNTFGWHVHYIALKNWSQLALKMARAHLAQTRSGDLSPLEEVIRFYDADRWEPDKYLKSDKFSRYQHPTPYKMREDWADEIKDPRGRPMRFAMIDVQLDYYVLVIRKWGRFSQSRLQFCAICLSASEIALHLAQNEVPPERVFFDTRHDTQRIRTICAGMRWRSMMGDKTMRDYLHDDGIRRIYDKPKAIDAMTGTLHQGRESSFVVEVVFSKNSALNRLAVLRMADSKAPDGSPLWTAASDAPEWYFKQINAHYRKRVENADGTFTTVWMGQKEDHADDCEAMGVVAASMAELTGAESLAGDATPPAEKPTA